MIEIVLEENGILSVDLGDVFLGRVDLAGGVRVQCLLPALIWEILEGDPIEDIRDQDAIVGESLKGGLPRATKTIFACVSLWIAAGVLPVFASSGALDL